MGPNGVDLVLFKERMNRYNTGPLEMVKRGESVLYFGLNIGLCYKGVHLVNRRAYIGNLQSVCRRRDTQREIPHFQSANP